MRSFRAVHVLIVVQSLLLFAEAANSDYGATTLAELEETQRRETKDSCLRCHVMVGDEQLFDNKEGQKFHLCRTDPDQDDGHEGFMYQLDHLSTDFRERHAKALNTGFAYICIPGGAINHSTNQIEIPNEDEIYLLEDYSTRQRRQLQIQEGDRSVLGVYVTVNGYAPVTSQSSMRGALMGTGPNATDFSAKSQYEACSHGKFNMVPATGDGIEDGFVSVELNDFEDWDQTSLMTLINPLTEKLEEELGGPLSRWRHVMVCAPFGGDVNGNNKWTALAFYNYFLVFLNSFSCELPGLLMHEIAHNYGLRHSARFDEDCDDWDSYGDNTDLMSSYWRIRDGPKYCFNAVKNSIFGWFDDKKRVIDDSVAVKLVAPNDYPQAETSRNEFVLLEVLLNTFIEVDGVAVDRMYVQWNRAEGMNEGVYDEPNMVIVTTAENEDPDIVWDGIAGHDDGRGYSYHMAEIDQNETYSVPGTDTMIEVCGFSYDDTQGFPDHAVISVYREGVSSSQCDQIPVAPSTPLPTISRDAPTFEQMPISPREDWTIPPSPPPAPVLAAPYALPPPFVVGAPFVIGPVAGPPTPAPVAPVTPSPIGTSNPAPVAVTPSPIGTSNPAPVAPVTPSPIGTSNPAPVAPVTPFPIGTSNPAPVAPVTPAPVDDPTPAPVAPVTPAPVDDPTPAPAAPVTPGLVDDPTPAPVAPVTPVTPAPVDDPTPEPVAPVTPAPVHDPTPDPVAAPTPPVFAPFAIVPVALPPPVSPAPIAPTVASTPEPTFSPTRATVFGACFPGSSMVHIKDVGGVPLHRVRIGDFVKVDEGTFEPIYSFGHFDESARVEYLQIQTTQYDLEISREHMVFVIQSNGESRSRRYALPAGDIQVGDTLVDDNGRLAPVKSITKVVRRGAFAPFTPSGKLVVNRIQVSSYVSFQGEVLKIGNIETPFSYQWLAHAFEFPHRLVCHHMTSCPSERYTAGISTWVAAPLRLTTWWLHTSIAVQCLVAVPLLLVLICCSVLEFLVVHAAASVITSVFLLLLWKKLPRIKYLKVKTA